MKIQAYLMTTLALLAAGVVACAADEQTAFDQANAAFAQKNYGRAAGDYRALIARQGFSAPVLFNLANAYYQDGKPGQAILNYERAQLLAPGDEDIATNLRLARAKAGLADRPTAWVEQAARFFSLNTLSWLGGVAILFIAVGLLARQFTQRQRFGWRAGMTASVGMLLATVAAVGLQWSELDRAIVTVKHTPVYIAPVTVGQPLYTLAEGQALALGNVHGDFVLVETSDGHRGWVKRADVDRLIPATQGVQLTYM
jgi:tetratricopeptide (TPR) repeat protein